MRRDLGFDWARAAPQQLLPVFLSLFPAVSVGPGCEALAAEMFEYGFWSFSRH